MPDPCRLQFVLAGWRDHARKNGFCSNFLAQ